MLSSAMKDRLNAVSMDNWVHCVDEALRIERKVAGEDITIVTYGACCRIAMDAAERLHQVGIDAEVVDLRTLKPLDMDTIAESIRKTHRAVVVHEACRTGGFGAELAARIQDELFDELEESNGLNLPIRRPAGDRYFTKAPWRDADILPPPENWGGDLPDNQIPADTPSEHIHAAVAACRAYGRLPLPDNLDHVDCELPRHRSFAEFMRDRGDE